MRVFSNYPSPPRSAQRILTAGVWKTGCPHKAGMTREGGVLNVTRLLAFLMVLLTAFPAYAMTHPDERLEDPVLAARADNIGRQIRCVVCQNQSIYDSDTEIAQGLRTLIAVQLKDGKTDAEIIDYIHERYGDFVLMKPPVKPMTWGLWFGPILILLSGGLLAMRMMKVKKRRRRS